MRKLSVKFFSLLFVYFCFLPVAFSCRQNDAEVLSASGSLVFDYDDYESFPSVRLSVFVNTKNEAQRTQSIRINSSDENFFWMIDNPVLIKGNEKNWSGYANLVLAENLKFSNGKYTVKYTDAQGNEDEAAFILSFNTDLYSSKPSEIKSLVKSTLSSTYVIYDKDMTVLYSGNKKNTWKSAVNVLRDYNKAFYIRKTMSNTSGSLLFLLPVKEISQTSDDKLFE